MTSTEPRELPPSEPVDNPAVWPYLVWQQLWVDNRWYCVAAFASGEDAYQYIRAQTGRIGEIILQRRSGVTNFPAETHPRSKPN